MAEPSDPDVAAATDAQLLQMAMDSGVITATRRAAIEVLYGRYADGLFRHCKKLYWARLRSPEAIRAFVGEVFMRFVESGRFDPQVAKRPDQIPTLIRSWLRKQAFWAISKEEVLDEAQVASQIGIDLDERPAGNQEHRRSKHFQRLLRHLHILLYKMSEKDQDILRTSFKFFDRETNTYRVPPDIQDALCKKWGFTSRNSLVKYRTRILEKVKQTMLARAGVA